MSTDDIIGADPFRGDFGDWFERGPITRPPKFSRFRKEWVSHSFREENCEPWRVYALPPHTVVVPFKAHWLIVTTPGVRIVVARIGTMPVIENAAKDLYHVARWDRLVLLAQLDRVRIGGPLGEVGNNLSVQAMLIGTTEGTIEGAWVGEQIREET